MTEPRDPMIDKLIAAFKQPDPPPTATGRIPFDANRTMQGLIGIPIEKAVEHVRMRYLHDTHRAIRQMEAVAWPWRPEDWVVVASPYIFPGWTKIDGVRVLPTCPFDWGVFLMRSPEFLEQELRTAFAPFVAKQEDAPPLPATEVPLRDANCRAIVVDEWVGENGAVVSRRRPCGWKLDSEGNCPVTQYHVTQPPEGV